LWDVVIDPEEISLGAGESAQVSVMVYIPGDAEDGDWDEVMITVVSQGDPEVWHEATLKTTAVVVGDPPAAGFSFAPAAPVAGEEVTFTNTTTGTEPITYEWDFGDGGEQHG
jgi:PKD repeat protein